MLRVAIRRDRSANEEQPAIGPPLEAIAATSERVVPQRPARGFEKDATGYGGAASVSALSRGGSTRAAGQLPCLALDVALTDQGAQEQVSRVGTEISAGHVGPVDFRDGRPHVRVIQRFGEIRFDVDTSNTKRCA
jgi:hypothetical protein